MKTTRNSAIVCCRIASMLLIVLCHIIGNYTFIPGHQFLPLVFNVGVHSFLVISGYLYGTKIISNWREWFRRRCISVALPALCMNCIVLFLMFCAGIRLHAPSVILYLMNLQGLGFLFSGFYRYFAEISVLGPLWFITVIMLCYCLIPILQKLRDVICKIRHGAFWAAGFVAAAFAVYLLTCFNTIYFTTFTLGYCMAVRGTLQKIPLAPYGAMCALMAVAQVTRLVLRAVWDGSAFYQCYTELSQMVLGIWILYTFFFAAERFPKIVMRLAENRWSVSADSLSFYVYLTHYCFCVGPWNVYMLTNSLLIATIGFVSAVLIAAVLLKYVVHVIQGIVN